MQIPTALEAWVFDNLPVGIALLDQQRVYRYANAAYAAIQGIAAPNIIGAHLAEGPAEWVLMITPLCDTAEVSATPVEVFNQKIIYPTQPRLSRLWDVSIIPYIEEQTPSGLAIVLVDVTCRQQLAHTSASEFRLRSLMDAAIDAIFIINDAGVILEANAASARMFGYGLSELLTAPLPILMPGVERERHLRGMQRYIQTGIPHVIGTVYGVTGVKKDGATFPCELSVAESEEQGQRIFIGILRDISQRMRDEERIIAREHLLDRVLESLPVGVWILDKDGYIVRANRAGQQIWDGTGVVKDDDFSRYTDWWTRLSSPILAADSAVMRAIHHGATVLNEEMEIETFDGTHKSILNSVLPLHDDDEILTGAIIVHEDITVRKRIERERAQLLAELEATISAITEGVILYDTDGRIFRMNPAAELLLHDTTAHARTYDEFMDHVQIHMLNGSSLQDDEMPYIRARQGETVRGQLLDIHIDDDHTIWLLAGAAPVYMTADEIIGVVSTFTDVTALHHIQEQQEDMLRIISHDLRNPVAAIRGHADLLFTELESGCTAEVLRPSIEAICSSARRLTSMIEDLVEISRLEGGHVPLSLSPVRLQSLFPATLERARTALAVDRVQLHLPAHLPPVDADEARLERIFINLISNALKYSPPDTPVEVVVHRKQAMVEVAIQDYGRGLSDEDRRHLFERYYRSTDAHGTSGLGLGLYIVKKLVEAHGGDIYVRSEPGKGSIFSFTLHITGA